MPNHIALVMLQFDFALKLINFTALFSGKCSCAFESFGHSLNLPFNCTSALCCCYSSIALPLPTVSASVGRTANMKSPLKVPVANCAATSTLLGKKNNKLLNDSL